VPLFDNRRQHALLRADMLAALARVCDSGAFILGAEVADCERKVAEYCRVRHAVGCASGSDALLLALMALDVRPGDEVILPSFTFFATASAVTRLGATPVFADIEPHTFNIDPAAVERLISPKTKVILPVHLFGQCARMDALCQLADAAGIAIIEDAAQAIGAEWRGRRAGSIGRVGCFSFYPTKNLGGAGDGGMLTTSDEEMADRLRLLRGHGMRPKYYHHCVGINSRLDSLQAAVLNVKLPHLDRWAAQRAANARRYQELFAAAEWERWITLPQADPHARHVWNQFVIRVGGGQRDALRQYLADAQIGTEIYYPLGLHQQPCFRYLGYRAGDLPETERAAGEVLALPIFPELTPEEQSLVVERIRTFFLRRHEAHPLPPPKHLAQPAVSGKPSP
jgi:dTDP-4-amino-4,6-dideoxygalactose transaminase